MRGEEQGVRLDTPVGLALRAFDLPNSLTARRIADGGVPNAVTAGDAVVTTGIDGNHNDN